MNISRFLFIASFVWLSSLAVHYLVIRRFFPPEQAVKQEPIPLVREIDFVDQLEPLAPTQTTIQADQATWIFSTHGGSLEQMIYKRLSPGSELTLPVFAEFTEYEKEKRPFLVALNEQTPYYYALNEVKQDADKAVIIYQAQTDQATIRKTFTVHKHTFQLDLVLTVIPATNTTLDIRLVYPAPFIKELASEEYAAGIIGDMKGSLKKIQRSRITLEESWQPAIFGAEDKFFVNAIYKDSNFIRRAYFQLTGQTDLSAIIQGPSIAKQTEWQLSFYIGPKDQQTIMAVDSRLEGTLEYSGILAPIAKVLLKLLNWLYKYLHNYGWAIVLLTLIINLLLLPLNIKSLTGMKKYAELQKKLAYVKQRYKDDPDALRREQNELLSKHGMSGLGGCLPKLLQLPIFFALSRVLTNSIQLYKAPFILWIKDLSSYDPYYVLPLLIVVAMIAQSTGTDPKQRFIGMAFALAFGAAAVNFSAGLCLYIVVGVLLYVVQTVLAKKLQWT